MFSYLKKPSIYIGGGVLLVLIALYFFTLSPKPLVVETAEVTKKSISQEVFITGTVKAGQSASLSFDRGGKITTLPVSVGVSVNAGTVLASLENGAEKAALDEAGAVVASATVALEKTKRGSRPEELRVKEAQLEKAEVTLKNLRENTSIIIVDAYNQGEVALNRLVDPLFANDNTTSPRLTFSNGNQSGVYQAETERIIAGNSLRDLQKIISSESDESETRLAESLRALRPLQSLFLTLGEVLIGSNGLSDAGLADYQERVGTARANITTAVTSLQNHRNAVREASAVVEQFRRELELSQAGSASEDIRDAEENLRQAEAKLASVQSSLQKTLIRAPFSGRAASKNAEVGETISAGETIMEFLGSGTFAIEANVPEADIAKISVGDIASVTLDAYGEGIVFNARVTLIEPAEKEIEGVPTYKTTFLFEKADPRLRSGLTANITIKKVLKEGALTIPSNAITVEDGISYVQQKLSDGSIQKVKISVGNRASAREVEVTEGLKEGDTVLLPKVKSQ